MYREVSDLSFGSGSEDGREAAEAFETDKQASPQQRDNILSWKTYTNELENLSDSAETDTEEQIGADVATGSPASSHALVHFNNAFEIGENGADGGQEVLELDLPTSWSACDTADLGIVAAHHAAAAIPPVSVSTSVSPTAKQQDETSLLLTTPLEAEDMLGFGTLDLRSCTLKRQSPALATTQRLNIRASFSMAAQV